MGITNPLHIAFIAVIALLVLGPKRLPELARTIGNGMREFRDAISGEHSEPAAPIAAPAPSTQAVAPAEPATTEATAHVAPVAAPAERPSAASPAAAPTPSEQELAAPPPPVA